MAPEVLNAVLTEALYYKWLHWEEDAWDLLAQVALSIDNPEKITLNKYEIERMVRNDSINRQMERTKSHGFCGF